MASNTDRRSRRRRGRRQRLGLAPRPGFDHEKALIIGVIEVLVGLVSATLAVVAVVARAWGYRYGACFWSGACFVSAGVCGIASARAKTNCSIALFLLLSAVSAALALIVLSLAAIGVASDHLLLHAQQLNNGSALVVHSLVIVAALIESVCGALGAVVGCKAICGGWYGSPDQSTEPRNRVASDHYVANDADRDIVYPDTPLFMAYPTGPLCVPPDNYVMHPNGAGYRQLVYVMPPASHMAAYPETAPDYQLASTPPPAYSTFDRREPPATDSPVPTTHTDAHDDDINIANAEWSTEHELFQDTQREQQALPVNETPHSTHISRHQTNGTTNRTGVFDAGWCTLPLATPVRITPRTRPHAWPSRSSGHNAVTHPQGGIISRPPSPKQRITEV